MRSKHSSKLAMGLCGPAQTTGSIVSTAISSSTRSLLFNVSRIHQALNGQLLLITGIGLVEYDGHAMTNHLGLGARFGVRDDQIFDVFQDAQGTFWYGTQAGTRSIGPQAPAHLYPQQPASTAAFRIRQIPTAPFGAAPESVFTALWAIKCKRPRPACVHALFIQANMVICGSVPMVAASLIFNRGWLCLHHCRRNAIRRGHGRAPSPRRPHRAVEPIAAATF